MHKLHDLLEVTFPTAKVGFSNRYPALPTSAASHLSEKRWTHEVTAHASAMEYHSSGRTAHHPSVFTSVSMRPMLTGLCRRPGCKLQHKHKEYQHRKQRRQGRVPQWLNPPIDISQYTR